jgi:c-di-GMP-binding flagellar brake protein YcgR
VLRSGMNEWARRHRDDQSAPMQRRFRAPVDLPVVLRFWRTGDEQIVIARGVDLSGGGIGVICDAHLSLGTRVTVAFELDGELMSIRGKVAHRRRVAHNTSRCGIEFNVLPQDKTLRWFARSTGLPPSRARGKRHCSAPNW